MQSSREIVAVNVHLIGNCICDVFLQSKNLYLIAQISECENAYFKICKSAFVCSNNAKKGSLSAANSPRFEYEKCPRMFAHFWVKKGRKKIYF